MHRSSRQPSIHWKSERDLQLVRYRLCFYLTWLTRKKDKDILFIFRRSVDCWRCESFRICVAASRKKKTHRYELMTFVSKVQFNQSALFLLHLWFLIFISPPTDVRDSTLHVLLDWWFVFKFANNFWTVMFFLSVYSLKPCCLGLCSQWTDIYFCLYRNSLWLLTRRGLQEKDATWVLKQSSKSGFNCVICPQVKQWGEAT